MTRRSGIVWAVAALLLGAPAAEGRERAEQKKDREPLEDPRQDLERLEGVLEGAVARVSRPSAVQVAARGNACVGYHLKGYGVVFVLPPRALPVRQGGQGRAEAEAARALDQAARRVEEALERVEAEPLRLRIVESLKALRQAQEQMRTSQRRAHEQTRRAAEERRAREEEAVHAAEHELEAQAEAFQREAEKAQREVERAMAEVERAVRRRAARLAGASAPPEPPPPAEAPAAPTAPAPPSAPLPPWAFWFETEQTDPRAPESVIREVGSAVAGVLEAHGGRLRLLRPEEVVTVAVDFFPQEGTRAFAWSMGDRPGHPRARAERTLIVRVRKKDLDERQSGRIASEELRKRIEILEY